MIFPIISDIKLPESPDTTPEKSCLEALERAITSETGRRYTKTPRNLPPFKEELEEITCVNPSDLPGPESRIWISGLAKFIWKKNETKTWEF